MVFSSASFSSLLKLGHFSAWYALCPLRIWGNWTSGGQKQKWQTWKAIYSRWTVSERDDLTQDLRDASGPSVDPFTVHWSLIRNGLHGRVAVKKPLLRKGNGEKRLKYAKWHKKWTENQWQQVLWRDESSPESGSQHYWSSVGSTWQRTEQKAANKEELWDVLQEAWRTIPEDSLKKWLMISLFNRVQTVMKNKGTHTKYGLSRSLELH